MTGYVAQFMEKDISAKDWILQCARAIDYLGIMRDDPPNANIPDEFKPSDYHLRELEKAKENLAKINKMTNKEKNNHYIAIRYESYKSNKKGLEQAKAENEKMLEMLDKIKHWGPPTPEHVGLKKFMIDQITSSFNSTKYYEEALSRKPMDTEEYWEMIKEIEERNIEYHKVEYEKEVERCQKRTEWVQQLKKSLEHFND